jgi:hypothetical protein
VWQIEHLPLKRDGALTPFEGTDNALSSLDFHGRWCECCVDRANLIGVDGYLAVEAVLPRFERALPTAFGVANIDENSVDCPDVQQTCSQ